jgi:energy-coupling factor transporter ATP-binding protein EcfA2
LVDQFNLKNNINDDLYKLKKLFTIQNNIILKNISFKYINSEYAALNNVSLEIEKGQFVGVLGPSGSGKSTLMDIILGLIKPDVGDILFDHVNINDLKKLYFIKIVYNATYYAVQLLYYSVPTSIGTYTRPSSGLYSTTGTGLPTTAYTPQLVLASTGSIKTIMGFAAGTFPSTQTTSTGNTLSTLTPIGSNVNSIIMQCSLISNRCTVPSDIIDSMPINNVSFGSNINYQPPFENFVSVSDGTFNNFSFTFRDQNLNDIYAKDPNVSITLIIRPRKK